ncbi:LysR family transcriptional regulator [Nitratireductor sp. ZSWI3]|uniref:LysR family transcriptional regulator n=1 Tax=Nitratireductor sp. ZSWI3 TaxID=2966359 RepID=UPI0021502C1C|nr:LysR family transcriptional regulator [Nitratireductor sp. ZSWI3]MCR4267830.1 LysR family transcriptional regulator [Nitratireductor sp. ZSWI3]
MRGSDFAELRAFAAVVEHGGFARAAPHLGMSPSALSQVIRRLEERLGVRLLHRTTRSVAPSEAGERFLGRLLPVFADLDAAVADVRNLRDMPSGLLRINTTRMAAMHYLAPMIGPFLNAYPEITFDIVVDDKLVDIVATRFDAGIRLGEKVERDMIAVRIGGELRQVAVAAPSYIERFGAPTTPHDLRHHRCINFRWPTDFSLYRWEFERDGEELEVAVDGPLVVNEPEMVTSAVLDGVGIAYLFTHQVEPLIATGRLMHLLKEWSPAFPGFYLYYPSRRQMAPALRAFLDFIGTKPTGH